MKRLATSSVARRCIRLCRSTIATGALIALALAVSSGVAFAYFKATGAGSGSAGTSSGFAAVTVSAGTTAGTALYPTSTGDLVVSATNTNPVDMKVTVNSIAGTSGCTTPALTLNGTPSFTIPAGTTAAASYTLSGAVTMGASASNDCQGQTLTVTLSVTVRQT